MKKEIKVLIKKIQKQETERLDKLFAKLLKNGFKTNYTK